MILNFGTLPQDVRLYIRFPAKAKQPPTKALLKFINCALLQAAYGTGHMLSRWVLGVPRPIFLESAFCWLHVGRGASHRVGCRNQPVMPQPVPPASSESLSTESALGVTRPLARSTPLGPASPSSCNPPKNDRCEPPQARTLYMHARIHVHTHTSPSIPPPHAFVAHAHTYTHTRLYMCAHTHIQSCVIMRPCVHT